MNCEHYLVSNTNIEAYGLSITGQVRQANEDSCGFATVPNGELFVVCDGMGGHVGGATASRIAVAQIIEHFKAQRYDDIYQALNDALLRANTQILGEAAAEPSLKGMGTTACIVLVDGPDAYIAHVGDSRIYLYEAAKQRLFRITKDHSLVQALVDQGQLDDRDAEHHPQKNVIMKALGTKEDLRPEVYRSPVQPATGDMFLICSDGLSGMVDDNGIEAILSSGATVEEKVQQLVDNANMPGKGLDNITAQVIMVTNSPYPASNHPDHNPRWRNDPDSAAASSVKKDQGPVQVMFSSEPKPRKRMKSGLLALIIVAALLMVGGAGIGWFVLNGQSNNPDKIQKQITENQRIIDSLEKEIQSIKNKADFSYKDPKYVEMQKESKRLSEDNEKLNKRLSELSNKKSIWDLLGIKKSNKQASQDPNEAQSESKQTGKEKKQQQSISDKQQEAEAKKAAGEESQQSQEPPQVDDENQKQEGNSDANEGDGKKGNIL
jgi:serine/threonine protein phosphatase PrpC